ncbi:porin [Pyxidicoccus caerfyrddinensis]|uniref:porin n=1 Tax=Pyxidicoccus caerfyrddinensis TaxID=2709663 RepID=UPI0013DC09FD|nr:porin [Pyxidicoccus caerfyrddinensis]
MKARRLLWGTGMSPSHFIASLLARRPAARALFTAGLLLLASTARAQSAEPAPFAWGDFTWMNGQSRQKDFPLQISEAVVLSIYLDSHYAFSLNRPRDNTLTGSASVGRHNEFGINLASVGVEWNYRDVLGRLSLQYGNMLNIIQDLDGTVARGRSLTAQNLRYIREATLGYHFDVGSGLNVEGGIFMSYIGLESYLLGENWNYTRSLVCDHTPFYFQGIRAQYFPTPKLKLEPWLMNGWQTYGRWNNTPSAGFALRWNPTEALALFSNFYVGTDTKGVPERVRFHHDHSVLVRYFNAPGAKGVSRLAFSINNHAGFESGGDGLPGASGAYMLGTSIAHRVWFRDNTLSLTVRGEYMTNPTRYLAQYPPPDLATQPGTDLRVYGFTGTFEVMPTDFLGLRLEGVWRRSSVPYFAGRGGTTSGDGFQGGPTEDFTVDSRREQTLLLVAANFRL